MIRRAVLLAAAFASAAVGSATPLELKTVDIAAAPWSAIGRINNSAYGRCSAILVRPDVALTAAHCLFNKRSGRFLLPASIHLLFGFEKGAYGFHTVAADIRIDEDYRPGESAASAPYDWAVLTLAAPVPSAFAPLPFAERIDRTAPVAAAGFGQERSEVLTASEPCEIEGFTKNGLLVAFCRIPHGFSGGPLIQLGSGELVGMAIASSSTADGRDVALAIPAARLREALAGP